MLAKPCSLNGAHFMMLPGLADMFEVWFEERFGNLATNLKAWELTM
jgi:hypothetical protein